MVTINTIQETEVSFSNITFRYLVELPNSQCVFGSARDRESGKSHLFLVFTDGRVYTRNGLKNCWDEVSNTADYDKVRRLVTIALSNKTVPCYISAQQVNLN